MLKRSTKNNFKAFKLVKHKYPCATRQTKFYFQTHCSSFDSLLRIKIDPPSITSSAQISRVVHGETFPSNATSNMDIDLLIHNDEICAGKLLDLNLIHEMIDLV